MTTIGRASPPGARLFLQQGVLRRAAFPTRAADGGEGVGVDEIDALVRYTGAQSVEIVGIE